MNENYSNTEKPNGSEDGILKGMYLFKENNYKGKTVNIKCNYKFDASFEMNTETLEFFYNTGYDEITNNKTNFF